MNTPFDYAKAWKEVRELEEKALPASALKAVTIIYEHAKRDNDAAQLVKAVVHQLKYTDYREEDAFSKNLIRLKAEAASAPFPAKPLLHSMLGEMYWQFYQNNRYRFQNRTNIAGLNERDVTTWSLEKVVSEAFSEYRMSLEDAAASQKTSIDLYTEILDGGNGIGRRLRPTLYDFLAHRLLDFTNNTEASIHRPAQAFTMSDEQFFAPVETFSSLNIPTSDSLSMEALALQVMQDLSRFHLADSDPEPLADVDLIRLAFVYGHHTSPQKKALYLAALQDLEHRTINHPVSTRATFLRAAFVRAEGDEYEPRRGDAHKWDNKQALAICDSAILRFKDSEGAAMCGNLRNAILAKSLEATIEETNIPHLPFRALISYKNFTQLYYRIARISRTEVQNERRKWERNYNVDREEKFVAYLLSKTATQRGHYTLPDDKDYNQHSLEISIAGVPAGEYVVLLSNREDFSPDNNAIAYAFTTVTNIAYIHRIVPDGSTDCFVMDRESGEPISGVRAEIYNTVYNNQRNQSELVKTATYTSDGKGYFRIPYRGGDQRSFHIDFIRGEDRFSTLPIDTYGYFSGAINPYVQSKAAAQLRTFFFLDRAIYRPGQPIYFKGLVVRRTGNDSEIVTGHSTTVTLYDVNSQVRQEIQVTTNEYGTFNAVFTAPASGLTGQMRIQDSQHTGTSYFSVEEYKRPKFEVGWDTLKGSYRLNDTITATGSATAFSGANIDHAKVVYRVVREARYPEWRRTWRIMPAAPPVEILNGETNTNAQGKFTVSFNALPDLSVDPATDPAFHYTLYADVTDVNGETHSQSTTVAVGYKSLMLNVIADDINRDATSKKPFLKIATTNFNGQPEPAKGSVVISMLQQPTRLFRSRIWSQPDRAVFSREEYYQLFPHDLFDDELNKTTWPRGSTVFSGAFNTAERSTVPLPDPTRWVPGEYVVETVTRDKDGNEVKHVGYLSVYSPAARTIPANAVTYFKPVTLTGEPGEVASFCSGTSDKNVHVLYELELDGKVLSSQWIKLNSEQRHITIPLREEHRGNIAIHYTLVRNNRLYKEDHTIVVPRSDKMLDISFETFRDKLQPGQQEQWKLLVKGKNADKVMAEMVATLYDESLDTFRPHSWTADLFSVNRTRLHWGSNNGFNIRMLSVYEAWNQFENIYVESAIFDQLNWFGFRLYSYYGNRLELSMMRGAQPAAAAPDKEELQESDDLSRDKAKRKIANPAEGVLAEPSDAGGSQPPSSTSGSIQPRSNFNETAFFYPSLRTNDKGEVIINFTIPEALTRWKMLGFAHTRDLRNGLTTHHLVTQKELMVVPNQPRFFREGDNMLFSVKITSLVDRNLEGKAKLEFFDPFSGKPVSLLTADARSEQSFTVSAEQSTTVDWSIGIPEGLQAVAYRVVASAGNFSDGEEMTLPVVTNRMLVTETLPLPIRGKQTKEYRFDKLIDNKSGTLRHQQFTLEFTSNPAWYAVQALPYLMEYPYDCVEQTFSKFYANSIAAHIATGNPRIRQVFDTWKNVQPDALLSKLEKNPDLKSALLEETPWVLQSRDDTQRKRNIALLFDLNRMAAERERAMEKIAMAQSSSGGFAWFPGLPEDRYMTQHIVTGIGHLDRMGVIAIATDRKVSEMLTKAVAYIDAQILDDYERLRALAEKKQVKMEDKHIGHTQVHYLYARSYFTTQAIPANVQVAFDYYLGQAKKYWQWKNIYIEGLSALALSRFGDRETPAAMVRSFRERALQSEEMGMYWKSDRGYYWYQAPIETQALMIEVFDEIANDQQAVGDLKVWLLKQKQTQDWKTTKATSEACYALLMRGSDVLSSTVPVEITVGTETIDPSARPDIREEAGTGYFRTSWSAADISPRHGNIRITKKDDGVAWGAAYWQYFEQLDKITPAATPLSLKKQLFLTKNTANGPVLTPINDQTPIRRGDLVGVRIELRVDRDMEYVHLKDMRASGFEPLSTLSTHRYQDGLYYYESTRDLATNFFIGYLPKGTHVFEYQLRASQQGNFSNGITTIQCMYAPEFSSHSAGTRVSIE